LNGLDCVLDLIGVQRCYLTAIDLKTYLPEVSLLVRPRFLRALLTSI
jgi:hypothetical protein